MSTFYVPKKLHFELIGKGGATIKKLSADFKVRINIPRQDDPSNGISVSGRNDDVEAVRKEFERILNMSVGTAPLVVAHLEVPKPKHGAIIGPKAATLRQIEDDSGCSISVPRQGEPSSVIDVEGTQDGIEKAKRAIAAIIGSTPKVVAAGASEQKMPARPVIRLDFTKPINEVLFFPDKNMADGLNIDRFLAYLGAATKTLEICVFTITDNKISEVITTLHRQGVQVRIITDNDCAKQQGSDVEHLARCGVPVKIDRTEFHMHHKFCVVDKKFIISGSFNWTTTASSANQENVMITNNPEFVQQFSDQFETMWKSEEDFEAFPLA